MEISTNKSSDKLYASLFAIFLVAMAVFKLTYIGRLNLCFDEAYYWGWAQRLAVNYHDQPGMVAWWIKFFTSILGNSEFAVRFGAVVSSSLFLLAKILTKSSKIAFLTIATLHITPLGTAGSILMMHDTVTILFWVLAILFFSKFILTQKPFWLYLWATASALAVYGKVSSFLMFFCVFVFLLLSKNNRKWFFNKHSYLSLLLFFFILGPHLIWNLRHNFETYRHVFGLGTTGVPSYSSSSFFDFLGGQLVFTSPVLFVLIIMALIYFGFTKRKELTDQALLLISFTAPILLIFFFLSLWSKTEANWTNIAYPPALVMVFYYIDKIRWKNLTKTIVLSFGLLLAIIPTIVILFPSIIETVGIEVKPQDDRSNEVYGWDTFGNELSEILETQPENTFVFSYNYQIPAILGFYLKGHPRTYCLPNDWRRRNQYDIWGGWENLKGRNGLYVYHTPAGEEIMHFITKAFKSVEPYKKIETIRGNTVIRTVTIIQCKDFLGTDKTTQPQGY